MKNMKKLKTNKECCKIESVVSVDNKGQILLPKEIRKRANIKAGDKLAIISFEQNDKICCFLLMKVDAINEVIENMFRPILKSI